MPRIRSWDGEDVTVLNQEVMLQWGQYKKLAPWACEVCDRPTTWEDLAQLDRKRPMRWTSHHLEGKYCSWDCFSAALRAAREERHKRMEANAKTVELGPGEEWNYHNGTLFRWWVENNTLFLRVYEGPPSDSPEEARLYIKQATVHG